MHSFHIRHSQSIQLDHSTHIKMPQVLSILQIHPKPTINVQAILHLLDKVGPRPFVLYSINGASRTGKSFMLNFFLQFLQAEGAPGWFQPQRLERQFEWQGGSERITEGIDIWPQPFIRKVSGREVAILLMDTQGSFDEKTTTHENAIIFAFSALLSSVLIWNQLNDLAEDVLQFFQCFVGFAKMAVDQESDLVRPFKR
jgi:atlastin